MANIFIDSFYFILLFDSPVCFFPPVRQVSQSAVARLPDSMRLQVKLIRVQAQALFSVCIFHIFTIFLVERGCVT